jgi:hypothetical protein
LDKVWFLIITNIIAAPTPPPPPKKKEKHECCKHSHTAHEVPLHDCKVSVLVYEYIKIKWFMLFKETINYIQLIWTQLIKELTKEKMYGCFMQDNAMAYMANFSMTAPEEAPQPSAHIFLIQQIRFINWENVIK